MSVETIASVDTFGDIANVLDFSNAIKSALVCASTDAMLPILCGVQLVAADGKITVRATDRYTLAFVSCEYAGPDFTAVLSRDSVALLLAALKPSTAVRAHKKGFTVELHDGALFIRQWGKTVISVEADGDGYSRFPDLDDRVQPGSSRQAGENAEYRQERAGAIPFQRQEGCPRDRGQQCGVCDYAGALVMRAFIAAWLQLWVTDPEVRRRAFERSV